MRAKILNRAGTIPEDGWYHIEVTGTHPAGKKRKQLIDTRAITSMKNRFDAEKAEAGDDFAGMLVDLDHLSHNPDSSTEAYGWLYDLDIRNNQLFGRIELTDLGDAAIRNKRVKWFSTEYQPEDLEPAGDGIVRPLRLAGLAFTNRPNNRGGTPISNREDNDPGGKPTPQDTTTTPMKSIAEKLGLPAEADEAAILAAITSLQGKVNAAETKDAEAKADAVLNTYGKRIPEGAKPHWRKQLVANRAEAEEALKVSFPEASGKPGQERIVNREQLGNPEPVEGREDNDGAADRKKAAAIRNRAHSIATERGIPFNQAFSLAQAEQS